MAQLTAGRRAALEVLRAVRDGDLADRALERVRHRVPERDRGWVQELVYGTFRLRARLDHLLGQLVRGGLDSLDPDVRDVLRLGAYQLLEMGSVPPYAAVSQSVELARAAGAARAAGLVNGVLQSLRRRARELDFPAAEADPLAHLETWGSHPRWLLERWAARWGIEETRALVEANNRRPELYLRPLGTSAAEALGRLGAAGVAAEPVALSPDSVRVLPPAGPREALEAVPAVVQDPAAALVVRFAAVPRGALVLDLCAAPGGKAAAMATRAARVVAADLSLRRLRRLRENSARAGLEDRIAPVVADGRMPPFRPADLVLLDAPCTGTGTFRRHPDARWRLAAEQLEALRVLQAELLEGAAPLVRPGGLLVYSTCSLEPEENAVAVDEFLARHPEFARERAPADLDPSVLDANGDLEVLPQRHGVDGSYAARLRKDA
jgi:16S rRNA (cytosine967-C5)-methyltransferase